MQYTHRAACGSRCGGDLRALSRVEAETVQVILVQPRGAVVVAVADRALDVLVRVLAVGRAHRLDGAERRGHLVDEAVQRELEELPVADLLALVVLHRQQHTLEAAGKLHRSINGPDDL